MFAACPWLTASPVVQTPPSQPELTRGHNECRSRSPHGAGRSETSEVSSGSTAESVTGCQLGDQWFNNHVMEREVRQDFLTIPQWRRKNIILKCIDNPPENPHSWLASCIRNFKTNQLQKRLEQEASVHGQRSFPSPKTSIPPGGLSSTDARRHDVPTFSASSAVPLLPVSASGGAVTGHRDPPSWSAELIAWWPDKKSRLVSHFLSLLRPATQTKMTLLAPATQASVAFAVSLLAHDDDSADTLAMECLRRLQLPTLGKTMSPADTESPRTSASPVQLQVIFVGPESLVSLVLAKSFTCAMESMCPGAFTLLPLVVISLNEGPSTLPEAERLKLSIDTSTRSLASLETFIENSKANFRTYRIKTLLVSIVDAVNGGEGLLSLRDARALHGNSFRFLWTVTRCSQLLRATVGDNSVCDLVFAPSTLDDALKMEMCKVVGPQISTANVSYNNVAPSPTVFGTPGGSAIVPVCRKLDYETQDLDGWGLAGEPHVPAQLLGGLISFIARTAETCVFQERVLTALEQSTLDNFTMVHKQTGERRLVSREWWLRWFGYDKTPMANMLSTQFPCHARIFAVTGSPAHGESGGAEPCGKQRWCIGCEKAFSVLDGTYCLPVMVDASVAMMIKARTMWSSGLDDLAWQRNSEVNRTHMCSSTCAFLN